jgi:L-aminopeptidase/D-esterase-like protein
MQRKNNDNTPLTPQTDFEEPFLRLDFPSLAIGVAEYEEGPTGCTVFHFPAGATAVADIRGGAHATLYTDYLRDTAGRVDAICLAGGSFYGLEAATGVAAELLAQRGYATAWKGIALVSGAIIFDFHDRSAIYPDKELGRAALRAARPGRFPPGARGAGRSATVGKWLTAPYRREAGGQGGAFRQVGPTAIAAFTVVNSVGALLDRAGRVVRGHRDPQTGERRRVVDVVEARLDPPPAPPPGGNTTLTVIVTNQRLSPFSLRQLARQTHGAMARAIDPFHTVSDGDVLYAVTTEEVDNDTVSDSLLSVLAAELAWDAVLNCFEPGA